MSISDLLHPRSGCVIPASIMEFSKQLHSAPLSGILGGILHPLKNPIPCHHITFYWNHSLGDMQFFNIRQYQIYILGDFL